MAESHQNPSSYKSYASLRRKHVMSIVTFHGDSEHFSRYLRLEPLVASLKPKIPIQITRDIAIRKMP